MASSPIITVSGFNLPGAIGSAQAAYMPSVNALRGALGLEQVTTVNLTIRTLTLVVINNVMSFWVLAVGAANGADPNNQVAPLDYNASTNNVYWQRSGGFDVLSPSSSRVTNSTTLNIASGSPTPLSFDTIRFDSGQYNAALNTRLTAQVSGNYEISASASFAANPVGTRYLAIRLNGSVQLAIQQPTGTPASAGQSNIVNLSATTTWALNAGDYVEAVVYQNSGNTLAVQKSESYSPEFTLTRITDLVPLTQVANTSLPTPSTVVVSGNIDLPFNVAQAGWYSIWTGSYPASGRFAIKRLIQADGQTSDTVIDFTSLAPGSPEGIINVQRNSIFNTGSPSIDAVRISHVVATGLATVDVHLTKGGNWNLNYPSNDTNYISPLLVPDVITADGQLVYSLKPNITGGTGAIDVPSLQSGGNPLAQPQGGITWAAPTGTQTRASFVSDSATLTQVSQRLATVINDLIFAGIFQAGIPATLLYTQVLALAASIVSENSVANDTDIFRISAAPDTTVQGIYIPVGTFNGHTFYKIQGWEYEAAGQNSPRQCYWSSAWSTWTISNASGNLYHSGATEASPWLVAQWKDQSSSNVTVTTVSPNIPLTYNALTDTHTAMIVNGSTAGYNGLYLRGADLNGKRRYYQVGTSSTNARIQADTFGNYSILNDSSTYANGDSSQYPDQVVLWTPVSGNDVISVAGANAVDLMSGVTVGDPASVLNGIYSPVQGSYNGLGGRKLVYRRTDGAYYLQNSGSLWSVSATLGSGGVAFSDQDGNFPWNTSWVTANLTIQQNKIASPGWINGVTQPNTNITGNITGNWHL